MDKAQLFVPFTKVDNEERMVYGYASTEALDSQGEIVKIDALKQALPDYMKFANVREMHQASAVGKTKEASIDGKGMYIGAKIVDDNAWKKVKENVYSGFSIGGKILEKLENEISGIQLTEISIVDRPANPEAVFELVKADDLPIVEKPKSKKDKTEIKEDEEKEEKDDPADGDKKETEEKEEPATNPVEPATTVQEAKPSEGEPATQIQDVKEQKGEGEPEMKKNIYTADRLSVMATGLASCIGSFRNMKKDTTMLESALKQIKAAIGTELKENEDFDSDVVESFYYADKIIDLHKAEITKSEKSEGIARFDMPTDEAIAAELKKQGVEVSQNTIDAAKEVIAGSLIEKISKEHEQVIAGDMQRSELSKKLAEYLQTIKAALSKGAAQPFTYVKIAKIADEKPSEPAEDTPGSPDSGTDAGEGTNAEIQKADGLMLAKLEELVTGAIEKKSAEILNKVKDLEERVSVVEKTEAAPKVRSAAAIDRFPESPAAGDLGKLEKEIDEVAKALQADPANAELRAKADALSKRHFELRRAVR